MPDATNFDDALEAFEEQVRDNIKQLSSKDPKARQKAAAWLGEAGDPTAITMLKQVYKDDPDPKVRATAQYSLGMFRKLEEALKQPDQRRVQKLLEDVAVRGKIGGRVAVPVRSLVKLEIGMVISAILVAVLALVVPPIFRQSVTPAVPGVQQPPPEPTVPVVVDKDRPTLLNDLQTALTQVGNSASTLQAQYQSMLGGGNLDCAAYFDGLTPVALSANNSRDFADLATIATDINNLQASLRSAKAAFNRVCVDKETVPASEFGGPMGEVIALTQSVATTQTALDTAKSA